MSDLPNENTNNEPDAKSDVKKTIRTMWFKNFAVSRSNREGGLPRVNIPSGFDVESLDVVNDLLIDLTEEEKAEIELAAQEVRSRFFQEGFGSDVKRKSR
ncbi:MAG: hypothetical protein OWU33_13110 [Firmicutes bacterium]|nr:hypothetical protein [Bacillota bacterium]